MKKLSQNEFIQKAQSIHGIRYDYSKVKYINARSKVEIICRNHGSFNQLAYTHLNDTNCPICSQISRERKHPQSTDTNKFIQKAQSIHGDKYDYSKVKYVNSRSKVCIICQEHGEFWQRSNSHLNGRGCVKCNYSKGELEIEKYLSLNNIIFKQQFRFTDCRNKRPLPFDFYLPELNTCIEYDGEQHFGVLNNEFFGGLKELMRRQNNDRIKTEYCKEKNIRLIRIRYDEDILNLLQEFGT